MRKISLISFLLFLIIADSCTKVCGCFSPDYGYFNIYYKSSSNPDLLNPKTGIYNPADVMIYEVVKQDGNITSMPAISNNGVVYKYVSNNGTHDGKYFVSYYCSIYKYKGLEKTLIQLKTGVTDTLTFAYSIPDGIYPKQIFCNHRSIWKPGDGNDIIITK
jgi:hypothetical protein